MSLFLATTDPGVFVCPNFFSQPECAEFMENVEKQNRPREAPNSMNKYGRPITNKYLKDRIAFFCEHFVEQARIEQYQYRDVKPLKKNPYGFIVDYSMDTQRSLKAHYDASDMTMNLCLSGPFEGGDLVFYNQAGRPSLTIKHVIGQAIIHRGLHVHRAKPLTSGSRSNLVLWCHSKARR